MPTLKKNKKLALALLIGSLIAVFLLPFLNIEPIFIIIFVIFYYTAIISFFNYKIGLFLILLIRPCLDVFSEKIIWQIKNIELNLASFLGSFVIIFTIFVLLKNYKKFNFHIIFPAWLIFIFIAFLSVFFTDDLMVGLIEWVRLLSIFSIFILSYLLIKSHKNLAGILKVLVASALIPGLVASYQFITKTGMSLPMEGIYNRIFGTFIHPNLLAYYLIIPVSLALFIFLVNNKKKIPAYLYLIASLFYSALLILTYTRGAWLALLSILFIIGILKFRYFFAVLAVASVLLFLFVGPINSRVVNLIKPDQYSSIYWRINLWQDGLEIVKSRPILGSGIGSSDRVLLEKRGEEAGSTNPHNDYLKIAIENGLVGLIAYLVLIFSLIFNMFTNYLKIKAPNAKALALLILSIIISLYGLSLVDNIIRNTALQWAFWALIGAGLSALSIKKLAKNE